VKHLSANHTIWYENAGHRHFKLTPIGSARAVKNQINLQGKTYRNRGFLIELSLLLIAFLKSSFPAPFSTIKHS